MDHSVAALVEEIRVIFKKIKKKSNVPELPCFELPDVAIENFPAATLFSSVPPCSVGVRHFDVPTVFPVWEEQKVGHRVAHRFLGIELYESFVPAWN